MGTLSVITPPTQEPITLSEAKEALRIEDTSEDARIHGLIKAAREMAEDFLDLHIMTQTLDLTFSGWPATIIELDVWPIQSIDSVKYDDTSSPVTEQTLVVDTDYYADTTTIGGRVIAATAWPSTANQPNTVRIRMTAGYTSQDEVPEHIKDGIKAYVVYLYDKEPVMRDIAKNLLWSKRRL